MLVTSAAGRHETLQFPGGRVLRGFRLQYDDLCGSGRSWTPWRLLPPTQKAPPQCAEMVGQKRQWYVCVIADVDGHAMPVVARFSRLDEDCGSSGVDGWLAADSGRNYVRGRSVQAWRCSLSLRLRHGWRRAVSNWLVYCDRWTLASPPSYSKQCDFC